MTAAKSERDARLAAITRALTPQPPRALKALVYIAEGRVTVLVANDHGIRLSVQGSKREPYTVRYGRDRGGYLVTECSCYNGSDVHPVRPNCSHIEIAKLLWRE